MNLRHLLRAGLIGLFALATSLPALGQGAGVGLTTTPPTGSYFDLNTTSPTNVGITADALAAWIGSGGSQGDSVIGTGVNKVSIAGGATTVGPRLTVGGSSSDTNIGIILAGKGTGAAHMGGTTLANGSLRVPTVASAVNQIEISGAIATTGIGQITIGGSAADTNAAIALFGKGTGNVLIGGVTTTLAGLQVAQTASAVNDLLITNGATGTPVALSASTAGADTNIGITITGKGTGAILLGGATTTLAGVQVAQTASRVNGLLVTPGATGTDVALSSATAGADANANLQLTSNGTGQVNVGNTTTCSGTTTATCSAQRFIVSITGLTTAAGASAAAMTVTNTKVAATDIVHCQTNIYAGTGIPLATIITPGAGTVAITILNVATSGSLNATVPVACVVL